MVLSPLVGKQFFNICAPRPKTHDSPVCPRRDTFCPRQRGLVVLDERWADVLNKSWRDISRPIIAGVLADNYGKTDTETRRALRDAYPFGERKYEPYKVWLDEIKRQLLRRKPPQEGTSCDGLF